jgi:hypothetical protein
MTTPPEVLLDRYLRSDERAQAERDIYIGKQALDETLPVFGSAWGLASMLARIQTDINGRLREVHPRFHFDYVDATIPNAIAFEHDNYLFIAVTMPLVEAVSETAHRLSRSVAVAQMLDVQQTGELQDFLHLLFFDLQLMFIVSHEYGHHLLGHCLYSSDGGYRQEITGKEDGDLESQAREIHADGYAVYQVVTNLLAGYGEETLRYLQKTGLPEESRAGSLLSIFTLGVIAFFFTRATLAVDPGTVDLASHPPQAVRVNFVMNNLSEWWRRNRPAVEMP